MNKSFTTSGVTFAPYIEGGFQSGPSISKEEQIRRLTALRKCKYSRNEEETLKKSQYEKI